MASPTSNQPSQRMLRVGEEIRRTLGDAFARGDIPMTTRDIITITQVRMSPDLKNARVYVSVVNGEKTKVLMDVLKNLTPYCRKLLAQNMLLRAVPAIKFMYDETLDTAFTVERLLRNPKVLEDLKKPTIEEDTPT